MSSTKQDGTLSQDMRFQIFWGLSWSYDCWIYNYLCNQCLSLTNVV